MGKYFPILFRLLWVLNRLQDQVNWLRMRLIHQQINVFDVCAIKCEAACNVFGYIWWIRDLRTLRICTLGGLMMLWVPAMYTVSLNLSFLLVSLFVDDLVRSLPVHDLGPFPIYSVHFIFLFELLVSLFLTHIDLHIRTLLHIFFEIFYICWLMIVGNPF